MACRAAAFARESDLYAVFIAALPPEWTAYPETNDGDTMMPITITIAGPPRGKGRPRATVMGGKVRAYTDARTRNYEGMVRQAGAEAMAGRVPLDGPLVARMVAYFAVPESWPAKRKRAALAGELRPIGGAFDCDNLLKVLDGLNGIVFVDDNQVVEANVSKHYRERPRLEIEVWTLAAAEAARAAADDDSSLLDLLADGPAHAQQAE